MSWMRGRNQVLLLTICEQRKFAMLADQVLAGHEGSADEGDEGGLGRAANCPNSSAARHEGAHRFWVVRPRRPSS